MLKLLEPQIREADTYYKSLLAASNGQFRESRTDLHIKGITATQIQDARKRWLSSGESAHFEQMMLQAHPEHYCLPPYEGEGIVEVIGEHMARLRVRPFTDVPQFVLDYGDPDFSFKKPTVLELDDGTVLSYILHEFRDTADGCDIILRLLLPMAMPETGIREHAEHLAIEFRSGITRAYEELNGAS
jgi:hypothetical protein